VARVYGEKLRRIAQAEPEFYHDHVEGPLLASGMDEQQMRETASGMSDQLAGVVQRMAVALYTRHQERYTIDHLVSHIEAVVTEERRRRPPAMCFLDLAGYTRLTEERGDRAAAALEMVERTPQAGLPPAHVGLHAGPVVFQDGDYFGRTVSLAARIATHAGPGQVLVSDQVVAECPDGPVTFEPIGPVPLRGVTDPVPLHRATRAG
jgi:adenylate cyclase